MNSEKRGSEKLLQKDDGLSALTAEELDQVAGGAQHASLLALGDYFPLGTLPPEIFKQLSKFDRFEGAVNIKEKIDVPRLDNISNGL